MSDNIYGIHISAFTMGQLAVMDFAKLVEFLDEDVRVAPVVISRIPGLDIGGSPSLHRASHETLSKFPGIKTAYNQYINKNRALLDAEGMCHRRLSWFLLNEDNRLIEARRWLDGETSAITHYSADYEWLNRHYPEKVDAVVNNAIISIKYGRYGTFSSGDSYVTHSSVAQLIKTANATHLSLIAEVVLKNPKEKLCRDYSDSMLRNKNLSEKHVGIILKSMVTRKNWPYRVKARITKSVLMSFAPVTRLKMIEGIIQHHYYIYELEDEADFQRLMFSTIVKHPGRVGAAAREYKQIKPPEVTNG